MTNMTNVFLFSKGHHAEKVQVYGAFLSLYVIHTVNYGNTYYVYFHGFEYFIRNPVWCVLYKTN